LQLQTSEVSGQ